MLRFSILLCTAYLLALFQSTVIYALFPAFMKPDLILILIIYLGISPGLITGGILVFFCGLLSDTFSGSPFGLFLFSYLSFFFFIKLLGKFLILGETITLRMILVTISVIFQALLLASLPLSLGIGENVLWPKASWILSQALTTCAVGWPLFRLFKKLDNLRRVESSQLVG